MGALASMMDTLSVSEPARNVVCDQGMLTAVGAVACMCELAAINVATPDAEQAVPLVVVPGKALNIAGLESLRLAAPKKMAA